MISTIWKSVMYGLFIGTTISSLVLFIFRIIPIDTTGMIFILYLYAAVGGITGYITHKKLEKNPSEPTTTEKTKKPNPGNDCVKDDPKSVKEETNDQVNNEEILKEINEIKKSSSLIKSLLGTRRKIEELKKESNSILSDAIKKLEKGMFKN